MANDYLCKLTAKLNELSTSVTNMQKNAGLYSDDSSEETLTGRIKALEESTISSDPTETNISRMKVEHDLVIEDGKITTEYWPIGGCINREVQVQNPDDLEVWEVVGQVTFEENVGSLGTNNYDGWFCTVTYLYAVKITFLEFEYIDVDEAEVYNLADLGGTVYRVIFTITPIDGEDDDDEADTCVLKWENSDDSTDYTEETIETEHKRTVDEEDFNHRLKITGSATVKMEIRNRLG